MSCSGFLRMPTSCRQHEWLDLQSEFLLESKLSCRVYTSPPSYQSILDYPCRAKH